MAGINDWLKAPGPRRKIKPVRPSVSLELFRLPLLPNHPLSLEPGKVGVQSPIQSEVDCFNAGLRGGLDPHAGA